MITVLKPILIISLIVTANSCFSDKEGECSDPFFSRMKKDSLQNVFAVNTIMFSDQSCGYSHTFTYWIGLPVRGIPFLGYSGVIYRDSNCIFLIPRESQDTVKYFDFGMSIEDSYYISWTNRVINHNGDSINQKITYELNLDTIAYSNKYQDSIYKFRFKGIGITFTNDDLVIYVGQDVGVIGLYNANSSNDTEEIISFYGDIMDSKKYFVPHRML